MGPPAAPSLTVGAAHLEGPCLSKPTQPMVGGSLGAPQVCTELGGLWQLDTGRWSPGENAGPNPAPGASDLTMTASNIFYFLQIGSTE